MTEGSGEPADVERDVDADPESVEREDDGDRTEAIIDADDTGLISGEREIFQAELAEAEESSSS